MPKDYSNTIRIKKILSVEEKEKDKNKKNEEIKPQKVDEIKK